MTETLNEQLTTEIATVDKDPFNLLFNNLMRPNDATLATRGASKGLRIYDEIERDCHAFSVLQKRKLALISRPVIVDAASNALRDRKARDGVDAFLKSINFDQICLDLLDATLKGFAAAEIMWRVGNGIIDVAAIAPKDQRRFVFDKDSMPRLITRSDISQGIALPERKFIIHRYGAKDGNPYGLGLGTRLFWPVFFKRQGIQFWLTFAD
jgi:phage gp29-like protein